MRIRCIALWLPILAGGCAPMAPPRPAPATVIVPEQWSINTNTSTSPMDSRRKPDVNSQWWLRFHDDLLMSLVADALNANTSVRSAQAALQQAIALRDAARADLLPIVNASASAQRRKAGTAAGLDTLTGSLGASWDPDVFGANRSAYYASAALAQASAAGLHDMQTSIAAEVALNYISLRSAQARLAIAIDNLASQEDTLQITQWRLQAGLVTALEAEQARAAADQTRAQLPLLQTASIQSQHALAVLTGRSPDALSATLGPSAPVPQPSDDFSLNIPAETLRQRPDVRYAERQVAAAMARVSQAQAARAPDFSLGGTLGVSAATLGALSAGAAVVKELLAQAMLPIIDGGARRAQVRAQRAALVQAQMAYEAAVLRALQEVEDSLASMRGDRQRLAQLQQASAAAGNASTYARQRFSSGLTDFQTVLETQRTQLSTQDSQASAGADLSADHVRLFKALGGGWQ